jgi:hypothetical protein
VFYEDELEEETFALLCIRRRDDGTRTFQGEQNENLLFLWKGPVFKETTKVGITL